MESPVRRAVVVRAGWAFAAALLSVALVAPASVAAESDVELVGMFDRDLPENVASGSGANFDVILDPPRRRGFQILELQSGRSMGRVIDLDSRLVVHERELTYNPVSATISGNSAEWIHTIHPQTGDLYLAYRRASQNFSGIVRLDGATLDTISEFPWENVTYEPNVDPENPAPCASTTCLPQAPTLVPTLAGIHFAERFDTGTKDALLLLMQDGIFLPGMERNANIAWLSQWDADTGHQDWNYLVRGCSNARFPSRGNFMLGLFQARLGTGIYVACQGNGGTGNVVRLIVDGLNVPQNERVFPGPLGIVDGIADPASDRMLLRVSNEEGESWWAFDGPAEAYAGVIGGTVAPANTANGIDPVAGRLYMMSPPTALGKNSTPGGLLMSDIRRSPAPQFLAFSDLGRTANGAIRVDTHPETGERLVWVPGLDSNVEIYRDNVPISEDPPLRDLDRFTIDVVEEDGVTDANFTGSGHAFAVRALMAGGLEGFPTTGPDTGGIRIGRWTPYMSGSPCAPGDRELTLAPIKRAGLSNNFAAASATVADADAGTKTDLGEPSARCYPRPRSQAGDDIWSEKLIGPQPTTPQDVAGDYPRPLDTDIDGEPEAKTDLDEVAGSDWPFSVTECSGDDSDSSITNLRPLDRGDPEDVPESVRTTPIQLERFRALVDCKVSEGRVVALSEMLGHEEGFAEPAIEIDVPDLGVIRVAEVSSRVDLFRDPERGLVSRSIATARGIQIGDHLSIDGVYAIAEAWAAGRPGTAATNFERFICGVRVKDEAPDQHVYQPSANADVIALQNGDVQGFLDSLEVDPEGGGEVKKSVSQQACGDPDQPALGTTGQYTGIDDEKPLIDIINRALGSRGRASLPDPDSQLLQGTPGGYLSSVQKDRQEEISSRAVNNDASTQVPALEIIIFNDDPTQGRGRQLYQFAGVDASVTYGIFLLNPPEDFDDIEDDVIDFTGGVIDPGVEPTTTRTIIPAKSGPTHVLFDGVTFLLRAPKEALLAAAIWALLYSPVNLAGRRRKLKLLA